MSCKTPLKVWDLIPVVSYLFLGGRCRYCKSPISVQYAIVELLTGILFLLTYYRYSLTVELFFYLIFVSILVVVAFIDLRHRIIPNSIILFGSVVALSFDLLGWGIPIVDGLLGLLVGGGSLLLVALFSLLVLKKEGMGGGDIKLMGMIGLFLGLKLTLLSLLLSIYIAGLISLILLLSKRKKAGDSIPYGPFIAIGTLIATLFGSRIIEWYVSTFWF